MTDSGLFTYALALAGEAPKLVIGAANAAPGSTAAVVLAYLASTVSALAFAAIKSAETKAMHRRTLERFSAEHGALPFRKLDKIGVERVLAPMADTPGARRNLRNVLRRLCRWAVAEKLIAADPTEGVKVTMPETEGWHTMTDAEREKYKARHPVGTMARAAYAILNFKHFRVSDARLYGPQHIRASNEWPLGVSHLRQQKTRREVILDVEPEEWEAISALPKVKPADDKVVSLPFLLTKQGKPYTAKGLSNAVKQWCVEAGLPHCSAHSFRKGSLTFHAERGASTHQLNARGGHSPNNLSSAATYTKKADQARLQREAAAKAYGREEPRTELSNVAVAGDKRAK